MRVGVFGGTFNPVHVGHLVIAELCREAASLDEVLFVPSARPPHKPDDALAGFDRRVEMLNLAVAGHPAFRVDPLERDRPGPSYTADTLDELAARRPGDELFFLLGSDSLPQLKDWRDPQRIVARATLIAVARPNWPVPSAEQLRDQLGLTETPRLTVVSIPEMGVASRRLRDRVAAGKTIRYLVPRAVEVYIAEKGLYRAG